VKLLPGSITPSQRPASVLVVDDDRRVLELLHVALTAHGYRVLTANDGEEALRIAMRERPDLVVLDVRLPRKSGFDVCESLRQDPEDPDLPIILVSAAAETDARLQGLARGADDYVAKPFSPKELIARIRRLLARADEARQARRRGLLAERELARVREEARLSHLELRQEQRLRELADTLGRELHRALDADELAARLLAAAQGQVAAETLALLAAEQPGLPLTTWAVRGDHSERMRLLQLDLRGELAHLLFSLARPVRRHELERFPELRSELAPWIAAGMAMLAPLRGPGGPEGLLVTSERADGGEHSRRELELLAASCEIGGLALFNARRCREQLETMLGALTAHRCDPAVHEAGRLLDLAARSASFAPRLCWLMARAVPLAGAAPAAALRGAVAGDPTGRLAELLRLLDRAASLQPPAAGTELEDPDPAERRAAALLVTGWRFAAARRRGAAPRRALERATLGLEPALDTAMLKALAGALRLLDEDRAA
jgi:DNA-binding response OmpR family regulator